MNEPKSMFDPNGSCAPLRCQTRSREEYPMKRNNQRGQILVLVALGLVVLIGVMGLAIDLGYLRYVRRQIQSAADAAAIAGALELSSCGTGCTAAITAAAQKASGENGFSQGVSGVTIEVDPPPIAPDPLAADTADANKLVEVIVSQPEPLHFASIFGFSSATITARGDAKVSSSSNCVYSLTTLSVDIISTVNSSCGMVIETNLNCLLGSVTAPKIGVVDTSTCPGSTTIATPAPADPLAYLPVPTVGPCGGPTGFNNYTGSNGQVTAMPGLFTFNPGVYCGGIQIGLGETANFTPGTYILNSMGGPGGLNIVGGTVTGTGVTFYNAGPLGGITFTLAVAGSVSFTAPTSGTYEGVLFFQDPANTVPASFNASVAGMNLTGAYYFPNAPINFVAAVDFGAGAPYTILDAKSISFGVGSLGFTINNDYSSLPDGSPIKGGAVLVE